MYTWSTAYIPQSSQSGNSELIIEIHLWFPGYQYIRIVDSIKCFSIRVFIPPINFEKDHDYRVGERVGDHVGHIELLSTFGVGALVGLGTMTRLSQSNLAGG